MKIKLLLVLIYCLSISGYAQTIDGGNGYSIMLCDDSLVWAVGSNTIGQLGNNTTTNESTPIKVDGLTGIISVQAGASHSLALKSDGTVWSWGNNKDGQLGNSTTTESYVPIQVPGLSNVVKIIAGGFHNIIIKSDSTAWIWGDNQLNQINGTSTDKLFPIHGGINVIDIAAGYNYTARLYQDTIIDIRGINTNFLVLSNVVSLGSGEEHFFMIRSDSTVLAWGDNQYGQLGDGTTVSQGGSSAVQVSGLTNIISIVGGQRHSIALKDNGTVWTWGWNGMGQLGDNTLIDKLTPIQVPGLDSVIEISAGTHHCMARRSDSSIWVWGNNGLGQLGNDTATNTTIPVQMMLSCIPYQCTSQTYSSDLDICSGDSVVIFGTYQQTANTYTDSLNTSNGCDSIIQITLTVDPLPTVSFIGLDSLYCMNNTVDTLVGSPSGGVFSGTGVIGGVFDPLVTGLGVFTITYSYTDLNGCVGSESRNTTIATCTSIDEIGFNDFKIYPNPSTGIIYIQSNTMLQILNPLGQIIYSHKEGRSQIDLSKYGEGIYFVKSGSSIRKLVLTK